MSARVLPPMPPVPPVPPGFYEARDRNMGCAAVFFVTLAEIQQKPVEEVVRNFEALIMAECDAQDVIAAARQKAWSMGSAKPQSEAKS